MIHRYCSACAAGDVYCIRTCSTVVLYVYAPNFVVELDSRIYLCLYTFSKVR